MIQRALATLFLGYHFMKTIFERIFRLHRRGLTEFRKDYKL